MTLAGSLKERVTIERREDDREAGGGAIGDWIEVALVWASVRPIAGGDAVQGSVSVSAAGVFTGSAAEARVKANALAGLIDDYRLSFESGETLTGRFLVTRLDYAGDYNGERSYTLALESSGAVAGG